MSRPFCFVVGVQWCGWGIWLTRDGDVGDSYGVLGYWRRVVA